jgi:Na+/melibiose symporter-like transporter
MAVTASAGERPPLSFMTKALFASGAVANAVKTRGLSTFLMIFYNQVVGLPPDKVSQAIFIALVFDALVDPTVGQISDNFRSPWGRRHPFMYTAALPVSVAFFLIWNPPALSEGAIFFYLLACLLTIRLFDTFFELPSSALVPELAKNYDERTSLISMRAFFTVSGGLGMTLLANQVFLKEDADGGGGILARSGYFNYSLTAGILIFAIILISTLGTHRQIPYLRPAPTRKITLPAMAREVAATLNNRAFIVASATGMFIAIAAGARNGLELYFNIYFWGLTQTQISLIIAISVAAGLTGVGLAPRFGALMGKKRCALTMFTGALLIGVAPVAARLFGWMPPNGADLLFYLLALETFLNGAMATITGVMLVSMVADIVEDAEVKTGRRSEGLLLSADNLLKKIVSGVGVMISGAVLVAVEFPPKAKRGEVDPQILHDLGVAYLPLVASLYGIAILCLLAFNIDKAKHEDNLRKLNELAAREVTTGSDPVPATPRL